MDLLEKIRSRHRDASEQGRAGLAPATAGSPSIAVLLL
jgi:hypothetical protein